MGDRDSSTIGIPDGAMVSSIVRAVSTTPDAPLAPARLQADRLVLWLLAMLAVVGLVIAPLHRTWLEALVGGPALLVLFILLHRWRPGSLITRLAAGLVLQAQVMVLAVQSSGHDEPHLLFFLAATALIAYQDWRCLWPGSLLFAGLVTLLSEREPYHQGLHLAVVFAHTGMCSACAALLRQRTLHAATITADLEHARRALADELAERRRTERELVAAKEHAEALARTKADFLATMSHELRTPMNGILGMSRLMADTKLTDEQREMLDAVLVSGDALLDIIGDVLDYSKMEAGRLTIDPIPCDLRRVCEAVLDVVAPKADEKGLALILRYRPDVPRRMVADAGRLRQVLLNLVGNAVKFTSEGRVMVEVSRRDGLVRIAVSDTGIGLTPAQRERLFQPFVQAEEVTTRTYGGTGLGLAISRHLAELMHGTVGVESVQGSGSVFWCELPLEIDGSLPSEKFIPGLTGHAVLVVDTDPQRRESLVELLASTGLHVEGTDRPPAAIDGLLAVLIDDRTPFAADLLARWGREYPLVRRIALVSLSPGRSLQVPGVPQLRKPVHADAMFELLAPGGTRRLQPRTPPPDDPPQPTRGTVLLADDHYVSLHQTEALLRAAGYAVVTAVDGVEALHRAAERSFDLFLVDSQLTDLDASQLVTALRTGDGPNRRTPVVAMGGSATSAENLRLLGSGVDDLLERPLVKPALLSALERWTRK